MFLTGWLRDCGLMTLRTKPQYLSALGRKRSSLTTPLRPSVEGKGGCGSTWAVMCCSVSCGITLLLLSNDDSVTVGHMFVPVMVAALISLFGGSCLAEYINFRPQEAPSIYSCCYQYSSEVLAFFIGWSWLLSQASMVACMCSITSTFIDANVHLQQLLNVAHVNIILTCLLLVLVFTILVTGISRTLLWHGLLMPILLFLLLAAAVIKRVDYGEALKMYSGSWMEVDTISEVLTTSSLCVLFFTGPQSILRLASTDTSQKTSTCLGPLNSMCLVFVLLLMSTSPDSGRIITMASSNNRTLEVTSDVFIFAALFFLCIELFHPLHSVVENMASDGLLFRNLSKKWAPFCFPVSSPCVQVLSVAAAVLLVAFQTKDDLLVMAVQFPLAVNTIVPVLVLIRRYRDTTSWQYEPMLHAVTKKENSRKHESLFSNETSLKESSTTCLTTSDDSSDTDIDSVVQQYKDQARIANMSVNEEHDPAKQVPEPTPSSWFRAKICICGLVTMSFICASILAFANPDQGSVSVIAALSCAFASTLLQGILVLLPQNQDNSVCCAKIPALPWLPGMASMSAGTLLLHCLKTTWRVSLGWSLIGIFMYFLYGIHSSTAANSFYNLQTAHIALRPMPSYGNNCITQIIPSQRKRKPLKKKISSLSMA